MVSSGIVGNVNGANPMNRLAGAFDTLGGSLRNPTDDNARRRVGSILRSRTGQIVNASGRDLTLEASRKGDRNIYRVMDVGMGGCAEFDFTPPRSQHLAKA